MIPNWIGVAAAAATIFGIWFGHVGVRKIEAASPTIWLPTAIALALGLALEIVALLTDNLFISGGLGIVGMTVLWDALEFSRQYKRIAHGHAPANPNNPRHARLLAPDSPNTTLPVGTGRGLAENKSATTVDWLDREPVGQPVKLDSLVRHSEE